MHRGSELSTSPLYVSFENFCCKAKVRHIYRFVDWCQYSSSYVHSLSCTDHLSSRWFAVCEVHLPMLTDLHPRFNKFNQIFPKLFLNCSKIYLLTLQNAFVFDQSARQHVPQIDPCLRNGFLVTEEVMTSTCWAD